MMVGSAPVNLLFAALSPAALMSKALLSCLDTSGAERPTELLPPKDWFVLCWWDTRGTRL